MKPLRCPGADRLARRVIALFVALGVAAAAKAQFAGSYTLTSPAAGTYQDGTALGTFGAWTATQYGTSTHVPGWFLITTTGSGLTLKVIAGSSASNPTLTFYSFAQAAGNVTFSYNATATGSGANAFYYTADGSTYNLVTGVTSSASNVTFAVASGATFGFRVETTYVTGNDAMQAVLSNFSAPAAIPEPASAGLLAGGAALGFVGLMGGRNLRRRASAESA